MWSRPTTRETRVHALDLTDGVVALCAAWSRVHPSERHCTLCRLYRRYLGKRYPAHTRWRHSRACCSAAYRRQVPGLTLQHANGEAGFTRRCRVQERCVPEQVRGCCVPVQVNGCISVQEIGAASCDVASVIHHPLTCTRIQLPLTGTAMQFALTCVGTQHPTHLVRTRFNRVDWSLNCCMGFTACIVTQVCKFCV